MMGSAENRTYLTNPGAIFWAIRRKFRDIRKGLAKKTWYYQQQ
jgi:hypothetical protein